MDINEIDKRRSGSRLLPSGNTLKWGTLHTTGKRIYTLLRQGSVNDTTVAPTTVNVWNTAEVDKCDLLSVLAVETEIQWEIDQDMFKQKDGPIISSDTWETKRWGGVDSK